MAKQQCTVPRIIANFLDTLYLLSNVKITFSQEGATDLKHLAPGIKSFGPLSNLSTTFTSIEM